MIKELRTLSPREATWRRHNTFHAVGVCARRRYQQHWNVAQVDLALTVGALNR